MNDMQENSFKFPEVFIVSSGRSGTTLLTSILNAGGDLYIPYESDFIARAYPSYQYKRNFTTYDYEHLFKMFKITSQQYGWGMSKDYVLSYLEKKSPQSFAAVNSVIYEAFHNQEGTTQLRWGIKRPVLIASLERIHDVYPQAKIVHLVRDGRDVYLSYKKLHQTNDIKFGPKGVIQNALFWVDGLRRIEDFNERHPSCKIHELRYSDLLKDSESTLRSLCIFLKIEYKPSMHDNFNQFELNKKIAPKKLLEGIHSKLSQGLDPQNTQKYKAAMSLREKILFELVAIPYLLKFNYEPCFPTLNTALLMPVRCLLYFLSRQLNDWRYTVRDRKLFKQAHQMELR